MDKNLHPAALHGFLKSCGLSVSRGDDGDLTIGSDGNPDGELQDFLDTPIMGHLKANKAAILDLVDAQPVSEGDGDQDSCDVSDADLVRLRLSDSGPEWEKAMSTTIARVVAHRWSQLAAKGPPFTAEANYIRYESRRLRKKCGIELV